MERPIRMKWMSSRSRRPFSPVSGGIPESTPQSFFETVPAAPDPSRQRRVGALWRRFLAFLVDIVVIGLIGLCLGYFFFDLLMGLGAAGFLVGYFVGFFYFAVPESSVGSGQSLGKRLLRLQVVGRGGGLISIERSFLRYTIFALPWFLGKLPFTISRPPSPASFLLCLVIFGLGAASLYLVLFNRHTRQGIHDLAAIAYVAEAGKDGPITARPIWKLHWFAAAAVVVLAAGAGIAMLSLQQATPQLLSDARQVESLPGVQSARLLRSASSHADGKDLTLTVQVRCTVATPDQQALANQIADSVLTTDPAVDRYSTLRIVLIRGYDIGIARALFPQTYSDSPAQWRQQFFLVPPQLPAR